MAFTSACGIQATARCAAHPRDDCRDASAENLVGHADADGDEIAVVFYRDI